MKAREVAFAVAAEIDRLDYNQGTSRAAAWEEYLCQRRRLSKLYTRATGFIHAA